MNDFEPIISNESITTCILTIAIQTQLTMYYPTRPNTNTLAV